MMVSVRVAEVLFGGHSKQCFLGKIRLDDWLGGIVYIRPQTRMVALWWSVLSTVIDLWSWEENVLDDTKRAMLDHCLGTRVHQTY